MDPHQHFDLLLRKHRALALRAIIEQEVEPGMRVLDAGCGSGLLSLWAAKAGAAEVVGVDLADVSLARALAKENGVEDVVTFIQGDLFKLNLENQRPFDVVLAMVYLNDPRRDEDRPDLVHGLKRFMAPNAIMVPDRVRYTALGLEWPAQRASDRVKRQTAGMANLETSFGLRMGSFLERLAHKPNKSLFPERRADGSIDTSGARVLSSTALFHEHDLHAVPVDFPPELGLNPTVAGELTTILWEQELLFRGTTIFRNQSIGWVDPTAPVVPGQRVALATDERWREDNLLSVR